MHNGQIGGFEKIRRALENSLSDAVFDQREGTTDSELFFLLMIDEGLISDPQGAVSRATARVIEASRRAGLEPTLKLTAAFSDGLALYAVRYASDALAPTLYTSVRNGGRCIVSEPFDREGGDWQAIPPASFVTITGDGMAIRPFVPASARLALVV
jgi:glutamine amidotransferase